MPRRPSPRSERVLGDILYRVYLRRLSRAPQDPPPPEWGAQPIGLVRSTGGVIAALHFPVAQPRGVLLLGHPGIPPAKGYFHRSDRIPLARSLGLAALTFDHGGFGESDDPTSGYDLEWADVLSWAQKRYPGLPIHAWGVSVGGYFLHHALSARRDEIASAIFEEVSPDLLLYGERTPLKIARLLAKGAMPDAMRWFPAEAHAPFVQAERVLYVQGGSDKGIPLAHAERLWHAAGPLAKRYLVDDAAHLECWKKGGDALRDTVRSVLAPT
jgi:pimeloyl-ACP methyl ester carboxylesterase